MATLTGSLTVADYELLVRPTDGMPPEVQPVLFGLFGEVGSVMAASKKLHREKEVYVGFREAAVEEFGDALWYFAAIARRLNLSLEALFSGALAQRESRSAVTALDSPDWPIAIASQISPTPALDASLQHLGKAAGVLLANGIPADDMKLLLEQFAMCYLAALQACAIPFSEIARHNATKTRGRFLTPDPDALPRFDDRFDEEERIPDHFEIRIAQRRSGKAYLRWNNVFIGDPLTDNIRDPDGYRFHDVFHFAHAAVLHWSPVFRDLIKQKRKSDAVVDEAEDGGRAIVIEEGLTAWIFAQAKQIGFFAGHKGISFDLLKVVQRFVAGYEVERCPLKLWESAILQGYEAFLQVRTNNGGLLIGDRKARTLIYQP